MKGKIILIVGASGSGKTTIGKELEKHGIPQLVSFTTREKREGEQEGVDYYYSKPSDLYTKDVIESSQYSGNHYGLFATEVESKLEQNENVYFICNKDGADQIRTAYPDNCAYVWLSIGVSTMIERMKKRGDNASSILDRVYHAAKTGEFEEPKSFIHVNGKMTKDFLEINSSNTTIDIVNQILEYIK